MMVIAFLIVYFMAGTWLFYRDVKSGRLNWDVIEATLNTLSTWAYMLVIVIVTLMVLFLWVPSTVINLFKGGNK